MGAACTHQKGAIKEEEERWNDFCKLYKDVFVGTDALRRLAFASWQSPLNFMLPTIDSVLWGANQDMWFSDIDLEEIFLNYFLDEDLRRFAGVDVREIGGEQWERWERTLMGF